MYHEIICWYHNYIKNSHKENNDFVLFKAMKKEKNNKFRNMQQIKFIKKNYF